MRICIFSTTIGIQLITGALALSAIHCICGYSADYIGRKGEEKKELRRSYRDSKRKEGHPLGWEVMFRGVGKGYTPLEKKAGFSERNSLKIYVQYSGGDLIPIDIRDLDTKAKEAGKDIFPLYLPEDIGVSVLENNLKNMQMLTLLKDGDKITLLGTIKESRYRGGARKLSGFVHIAQEIKVGWNTGKQTADVSNKEDKDRSKNK
jgi:hypothetical protein